MKQTAVEWLSEQLLNLDIEFDCILIDRKNYWIKRNNILEQAKEMEKQQIGYNNEQMMEYAKFCIHCYNQGLPNIMPNDWKNLHENEQRNSI